MKKISLCLFGIAILILENSITNYISILGKFKINDITVNHYKLFRNKLLDSKLSVLYCSKVQGLFTRLIRFANKYYSCKFFFLML